MKIHLNQGWAQKSSFSLSLYFKIIANSFLKFSAHKKLYGCKTERLLGGDWYKNETQWFVLPFRNIYLFWTVLTIPVRYDNFILFGFRWNFVIFESSFLSSIKLSLVCGFLRIKIQKKTVLNGIWQTTTDNIYDKKFFNTKFKSTKLWVSCSSRVSDIFLICIF